MSVLSGVWFAWPLNIPLLPTPEASAAARPKIAWATAQLAARLDGGASGTETIFLLQIDGAAPEVALANVPSRDLTVSPSPAAAPREKVSQRHWVDVFGECGLHVSAVGLQVAAGKATATQEGEHTVLRGIAAGTAEFASVKVGQTKVVLVLLPWEMRDRVWCV